VTDHPAPHNLDRVVDDYAPRQDAVEWATAELAAGRAFEAVTAELEQGGWPAADAAEIVEAARRESRAERGVVTREQIAREANRRYRQGLASGWMVGFPTVAALKRLVHAVAHLAVLRRLRRARDESERRSGR
jgi:hypothetical protein